MTQVTNEKTCLVIGPIGDKNSPMRERSDALFSFIITPVVTKLGYDPIRADQISQQGLVTNQIIRRISNAPLVIADLTEQNPNVFYGLAIGHMLRRPSVHMLCEGERVPFDLAGVRIIEYPRIRQDDDITLLERIERTKEKGIVEDII